MACQEVLPAEALVKLQSGEVVLLDVRTPAEWQGVRVPGSLHIPMDELTMRYQELDPETETLVLCAHGIRSAACADWLSRNGFEKVSNVRHGISAWPGPVEHGE